MAAYQLFTDIFDWERRFVYPERLERFAQPGDLIEVNRIHYMHWAMYSEEPGMVYNIPAEGKDKTKVVIVKESLRKVAGPSKVRVNNLEDIAKELGYTKRNPKDAIKAAKKDLKKELPYDLYCMNCEHYCTKWLYGRAFSAQVMDAANAPVKVLYHAATDGHDYLVRKCFGNSIGKLYTAMNPNPLRALTGNPWRDLLES